MAIGKKLMLCNLIFFQAPGTPKKVLDISGKSTFGSGLLHVFLLGFLASLQATFPVNLNFFCLSFNALLVRQQHNYCLASMGPQQGLPWWSEIHLQSKSSWVKSGWSENHNYMIRSVLFSKRWTVLCWKLCKPPIFTKDKYIIHSRDYSCTNIQSS